MGIYSLMLNLRKEVIKKLQERDAFEWGWDLDPNDNVHSSYPIFKSDDAEEIFERTQALARDIQCLLCEAQYGLCDAEKCFFKKE